MLILQTKNKPSNLKLYFGKDKNSLGWKTVVLPFDSPHIHFYCRNCMAASSAVITLSGIIRALFSLKQTNKRIYSFWSTCFWILSAVITGIYILPFMCIIIGSSGQLLEVGVVIIWVTDEEMQDQRGEATCSISHSQGIRQDRIKERAPLWGQRDLGSNLCYLTTGWPWVNCFTSLNLHFLVIKMAL